MTVQKRVLVIANVTAASDELCEKLIERARHEPVKFMLVVPATSAGGGPEVAQQTVARAVARLRDAGLDLEGVVGNPDPAVAVTEIWDPRRFDEIVVSTLPIGSSRWLRAGLPQRIARLTGALVTHAVCSPAKPPPVTSAPPQHEDWGLGPLAVLGWSSPHDPAPGAREDARQRTSRRS